jgi:flagellar FliL protein
MAAQEDSTAQTAENAPAPGGLKAKLPMIGLIVAGMAVGGGTGAVLIGPMVAKKLGQTPSAAGAHPDSTDGHAAGAPDGKASAPAPVHLLENLVLNPSGTGGSRFLLLSVAIECKDAKVVDELKNRDAELRDIILTALGMKTVDQLTDVATRESIKNEILATIADRFGKQSVKRLYFPQFVVQ